jgi:hypothetical protein
MSGDVYYLSRKGDAVLGVEGGDYYYLRKRIELRERDLVISISPPFLTFPP